MLFWIFLTVLILSIILALVFCDHDCCFIFISTTIVSCLAIIISLAILMCNHLGVDGYVSQMNTRYEMLTYQYENDVYENDNDIGKRELITDIQSWNEHLAWNRENQRDLWIGIYIPNIYDQFESISLDKKGVNMNNNSDDFRTCVVKMVKASGQELIDKAEELVGNGELMTNLEIRIKIVKHGQLFGDDYPDIEVTRGYVSGKAIDVIQDRYW